ncbi:hypothetical protein [Corynebacterium sp. NML130628]|uniref:hypothetical protein n=1 Tax=Corynebacterium sp. NML130628 TaxID=1906333 RepID=UPI00116042C4|nr:hypothetical protein [Corynebacterium sp. NML130628]
MAPGFGAEVVGVVGSSCVGSAGSTVGDCGCVVVILVGVDTVVGTVVGACCVVCGREVREVVFGADDASGRGARCFARCDSAVVAEPAERGAAADGATFDGRYCFVGSVTAGPPENACAGASGSADKLYAEGGVVAMYASAVCGAVPFRLEEREGVVDKEEAGMVEVVAMKPACVVVSERPGEDAFQTTTPTAMATQMPSAINVATLLCV